MFKHFLLPTDGSALSHGAVEQGIALAKAMDARVTGLYVAAPFHALSYEPSQLQLTRDEYEHTMKERTAAVLGKVESAAAAAGVPCDTVAATSDDPYEEILRAADTGGCDLIVMASHGWRGVKALLLGSETQKVLTHGTVPVLVYR